VTAPLAAGSPSGRRTVRRDATLEGVGMHTGAQSSVTFRAAPPGAGLTFRRVDLPGAPTIPARLTSVTGVERRTTLGDGKAEVHTVEHVLAAVAGLGIDDLVIDLAGPEPPILDGSFAPFARALAEAGLVEHGGDVMEYTVTDAFHFAEGESSYLVGPSKAGLQLDVTIEFPHPLIGRQARGLDVTPESFGSDLAGARTFGFVREVEALRAKGLIVGGSTENAVVLDETGVVGTTLRWPDEFVRHKAGDLVGDLALVGGRVRAHIVAIKPSHKGNVALGRELVRHVQHPGRPALDLRKILDVIPHRYPMLLVDRILDVEPGKRITGIKNVTINEPFFQGHFPGHPIMPGVLIIEAMAQVGGLLLMSMAGEEKVKEKVLYFMSLDNVKFRRPVIPGDQIRFELEMVKFSGKTCRMKGVGYVEGKAVAEAEMVARVIDR
jgi:UDP-3-O-[3-hydroxymyristoyl] N-acetylglucosamine deacetylase / 3-hydroxyacyl-[acyl-carrier-protein] dehydratase